MSSLAAAVAAQVMAERAAAAQEVVPLNGNMPPLQRRDAVQPPQDPNEIGMNQDDPNR